MKKKVVELEEQGFVVTTNLKKIAKLDNFVRIVQGGSSAGKTYSIIPLLINYAIENPNKMISVVSESMPHLKRGAMRDFERIMRATGRWIEGALNKQHSTYHFTNGSKINSFPLTNLISYVVLGVTFYLSTRRITSLGKLSINSSSGVVTMFLLTSTPLLSFGRTLS